MVRYFVQTDSFSAAERTFPRPIQLTRYRNVTIWPCLICISDRQPRPSQLSSCQITLGAHEAPPKRSVLKCNHLLPPLDRERKYHSEQAVSTLFVYAYEQAKWQGNCTLHIA